MQSFVANNYYMDLLMEGSLFELQERFRGITSPPIKGNTGICRR